MTKRDIDTPALILDLDIVEENIRTMAAYFAARPQTLRPHFKTPKTPEIARRQLAAGAIGIRFRDATRSIVFSGPRRESV
jgi:D-serine deaminase-like pyridoxal phosphate-dependent protein